MSEDYTWDETITPHGYAVQNAGIKRANATLAARVQELERENAELRAKLDAVPVPSIIRDWTGWGNRDTTIAIDNWVHLLMEQERERSTAVQP